MLFGQTLATWRGPTVHRSAPAAGSRFKGAGTGRYRGLQWVRTRGGDIQRGHPIRRLLLAFAVVIVTVGATFGSVQASAAGGWSIVRTPNPVSSSLHFGSLDAVSCASSSMCIAVGSGVNDRANQIAMAASWNGATWTALHPAAVGIVLRHSGRGLDRRYVVAHGNPERARRAHQ